RTSGSVFGASRMGWSRGRTAEVGALLVQSGAPVEDDGAGGRTRVARRRADQESAIRSDVVVAEQRVYGEQGRCEERDGRAEVDRSLFLWLDRHREHLRRGIALWRTDEIQLAAIARPARLPRDGGRDANRLADPGIGRERPDVDLLRVPAV